MNQDDFKQLVEEHGQMSHYLGWTVLPNIIMVIIIVIILMIVFTIIPVPPILLLVLFSGIVSFSTILALYHLQNNLAFFQKYLDFVYCLVFDCRSSRSPLLQFIHASSALTLVIPHCFEFFGSLGKILLLDIIASA